MSVKRPRLVTPPATGTSSSSTGPVPAGRIEEAQEEPDRIPRPQVAEPTGPGGRRSVLTQPDRELDKALVHELLKWTGKLQSGHTKFLNIHKDCGNVEFGPEELIKRIESCWNSEEKFELIFVQIARDPVARRVATPHVESRLCPWRKTILIPKERDICRVEEWIKIYGIGAVSSVEERYRVERIEWAVHVFGREKISPVAGQDASAVENIPSVDELSKTWTSTELPRSLGRLTKFLMSANPKMRLRGLQVLHKRFWHAKEHTLRMILDRAGIDLTSQEIRVVVQSCPVCRKWKLPPLPPKVKATLAEAFNDIVDFDNVL